MYSLGGQSDVMIVEKTISFLIVKLWIACGSPFITHQLAACMHHVDFFNENLSLNKMVY